MTEERRLRLLDDVSWHARHYQQGHEPTEDDTAFLAATALEVVRDLVLGREELEDACLALVVFRGERGDVAQGVECLRLALAN